MTKFDNTKLTDEQKETMSMNKKDVKKGNLIVQKAMNQRKLYHALKTVGVMHQLYQQLLTSYFLYYKTQ